MAVAFHDGGSWDSPAQDALSLSQPCAHEVPWCCCLLQQCSRVSASRFSRVCGGPVRRPFV
eukprot:3381491-Rhodomonas_salina.1